MDDKKRDISDFLSQLNDAEQAALHIELKLREERDLATYNIKTLREVIHGGSTEDPFLIDGLLRQSEVLSVISSAKVGKSWLVSDLSLAVATGSPWMGFPTKQGSVLIVDNELKIKTTANRMKRIIEARGYDMSVCESNIDCFHLRGKPLDIYRLTERIMLYESEAKKDYDLIVIDALYRAYPIGMNENDNAQVTQLFNRLTEVSDKLKCSFAVVHHAGKGSQSGKNVTDVGRGGSALQGAVDCHLVLRAYNQNVRDISVLEAIPRTFPEPAAKCLRFAYPVWVEAPEFDPAGAGGGGGSNGNSKHSDEPVKKIPEPDDFARQFVTRSDMTWVQVQEATKAAGLKIGEKKIVTYLDSAVTSKVLVATPGKNRTTLYSPAKDDLLAEIPQDVQNIKQDEESGLTP